MNRRWNREGRAKHSRLSHRKSQIAHAHRAQTLSRKCSRIASCFVLLHLIFNCRGDPRQACRPYRIQQLSLASKMSVSRIRRDTRLPCCLPQNDCIGSSNTGHLEPGRHERVAQITVAKGLALLNGDVLFHCLFKEKCTAESAACGQHPLFGDSVCEQCLLCSDTSLKGRFNMADGFIWYELVTNDMDKAVNFYKKVVGWDVKDAGMPGFTYMIFGKDGKDVGGMMTWAGAGAPELPPEWLGHLP